MKFEYKILWIDNDLQSYIDNDSVRGIEEFLLEKGFEPIIEKVFDEANLDQFITKHTYDLIISDYNLNNTTGDVVIKQIRDEKHLDTEILFYTAQDSYMNNDQVIKNLAFKERLTFKVGRDGLFQKIEKVIDLTLKKLLELNATRGLITAATSELDVEIEEIVMQLVSMQNKSDKDLRQIVTDKVFTKMERTVNTFWGNYSNFQDYFPKIDAVKKWEILRYLLKPLKSKKQEINTFLENNKTYQDQVITIRNQFAHVKAVEENGVLKLKGKEDIEFDENKCIEIRKNLIAHKGYIEILRQILNDKTNNL
ncbi:Response regulator receiver domain-containing protein [Flexibacter flexilis DSM 6793]|uniref:Response regulator receiver domain-containing protein n=1 Tax=Flexibacter flexilis DSM 6793 TaxID=927664 RepID=A0A1I1J8M4_9BACT|nr:response regulator [Flexibacter flexilis]SFC44904.1 Response regulator receiver domain-containing protein [Flexibacter flexilis DSM 6793]